MATWPGGSCWSFCCCTAVLGVITLKPDATSIVSLFWVLLVVAQPTVNVNRAMTLIMLNKFRICFMILGSFRIALFLICHRRPLASTYAADSPLDPSELAIDRSSLPARVLPNSWTLVVLGRTECYVPLSRVDDHRSPLLDRRPMLMTFRCEAASAIAKSEGKATDRQES
jgi:hypothetical protein